MSAMLLSSFPRIYTKYTWQSWENIKYLLEKFNTFFLLNAESNKTLSLPGELKVKGKGLRENRKIVFETLSSEKKYYKLGPHYRLFLYLWFHSIKVISALCLLKCVSIQIRALFLRPEIMGLFFKKCSLEGFSALMLHEC